MLLLSPLVYLFKIILTPIAPLTWLGLPLTTLDVVAALRLCIALRQVRESLHREHVARKRSPSIESHAFARRLGTTLMVVYGGEAMTNPFLGLPPSFMLNGVGVTLYTVAQIVVDALPFLPAPSFETELPLSFVDGITRAYLLCDLIPPVVVANTSEPIASSAWTLLLSSFITANGGFFLTNLVSFLHPTPLTLQTPPEMQEYGWTTVDLWCAPFVTGVYALLTHAQPYWADVHSALASCFLSAGEKSSVSAVDPEFARAFCAILLASIFVVRTINNYTTYLEKKAPAVPPSKKMQ
ncbi:hypothetical protein FISHEDRAFT_73841 [Fistulina hepatica ATCC 64428]|uniref:Uncharacterized protein n=1 Tax=Fistulina hepatica ATCC 64428 TaxID=1128425 RepID=A0A0D7AB91_9AGAR|nr:hypothetical protein FISHEDRAFT_73841 [Fistulina hepatica ATCC 64428]